MKWESIPPTALLSIFHDDVDGASLPEKLFKIISEAYAPIGGYLDYKTPGDLPGDATLWQIAGGSDPQAVVFGKHTPFGIKWTGLAATTNREARKATVMKFRELVGLPGNYAEVSGCVADHLLNRDCPVITDERIVRAVLGKDVAWKTGGWYARMTHGCVRTKIMVGQPRLDLLQETKVA